MIIVRIKGGLGNQMFQYAFAKTLQGQGRNVKIDIGTSSVYLPHGGYQLRRYCIDLPETSSRGDRLLNKFGLSPYKRVNEKSLLFDEKLLNVPDNTYVEGYFQCERYFKEIRETLLSQFTINEELSPYSRQIEAEIKSKPLSCSIHIRRGDYLKKRRINIVGICGVDYYQRAIERARSAHGDVSYFVFSDDMGWVKEHLPIPNAVFIDDKARRLPHEDIYLMSLCRHNIIANSTFSWWAAWLNEHKEKMVIAPQKWFLDERWEQQTKDIVCRDWIRL